MTPASNLLVSRLYCPNMNPISRPPTPMSPSGTSVCSPMILHSSTMKLWQKRITSPSDFPFGSKSEPPFAPPIGSPVREFLKICSNPRNLMIPRYTEGWNRSPPLYGPSALLNWTRSPRLIWTSPLSSCQGTRKIVWRSGSQIRSMTLASVNSGYFTRTGPSDSSTSLTAWWNSDSPGLRFITTWKITSSLSVNAMLSPPFQQRNAGLARLAARPGTRLYPFCFMGQDKPFELGIIGYSFNRGDDGQTAGQPAPWNLPDGLARPPREDLGDRRVQGMVERPVPSAPVLLREPAEEDDRPLRKGIRRDRMARTPARRGWSGVRPATGKGGGAPPVLFGKLRAPPERGLRRTRNVAALAGNDLQLSRRAIENVPPGPVAPGSLPVSPRPYLVHPSPDRRGDRAASRGPGLDPRRDGRYPAVDELPPGLGGVPPASRRRRFRSRIPRDPAIRRGERPHEPPPHQPAPPPVRLHLPALRLAREGHRGAQGGVLPRPAEKPGVVAPAAARHGAVVPCLPGRDADPGEGAQRGARAAAAGRPALGEPGRRACAVRAPPGSHQPARGGRTGPVPGNRQADPEPPGRPRPADARRGGTGRPLPEDGAGIRGARARVPGLAASEGGLRSWLGVRCTRTPPLYFPSPPPPRGRP